MKNENDSNLKQVTQILERIEGYLFWISFLVTLAFGSLVTLLSWNWLVETIKNIGG
ncbi:MAG: hypothetical protein AAGJ08_25130 [Cyanobacteria bacterium P01_H01_bin.35]